MYIVHIISSVRKRKTQEIFTIYCLKVVSFLEIVKVNKHYCNNAFRISQTLPDFKFPEGI